MGIDSCISVVFDADLLPNKTPQQLYVLRCILLWLRAVLFII